jgi:hypothetical protein
MNAPWDEVDALFKQYDGQMDISVSSETLWWGELRLTATKGQSVLFHAVAACDPAAVSKQLLAKAKAWLATTDVEPLAPGDLFDGGGR